MTLSSLFVFIVESGKIVCHSSPTPISLQLSFKITVESSWKVSSEGKDQEINQELGFIKGWGMARSSQVPEQSWILLETPGDQMLFQSSSKRGCLSISQMQAP